MMPLIQSIRKALRDEKCSTDIGLAVLIFLILCGYDAIASGIAYFGGRAAGEILGYMLVLKISGILISITLIIVAIKGRLKVSLLVLVLLCAGLLALTPDFSALYLRGMKTRISNNEFLPETRDWMFSQEIPAGLQRDPMKWHSDMPEFIADGLGQQAAYICIIDGNARALEAGYIGLIFGQYPISGEKTVLSLPDGGYLYIVRRSD